MRFFGVLLAAVTVTVLVQAKIGQECHPMDQDHPKAGDLLNCHRECNWLTEWCVPNSKSSTGWVCDHAHKRNESQPGQPCVAGGGTVFCSNCPDGYFCQNDSSNGWECDVLSKQKNDVSEAKLGQECHPMDQDHPKPGDLYNCHRDCKLTEWCVPNSKSSTGWACDHAHKRNESQPGQPCVAGGGTVFCSNCPDGYFCQNDSSNGWECDVLSKQKYDDSEAKLGQECHPMDQDHPKPGDLYNCHRDCKLTEWCVPNSKSSTGWACDHAHKRNESQPGQPCVAGGGTIFCSNCPSGYFCQNDGSNGWECDVMSKQKIVDVMGTPEDIVV